MTKRILVALGAALAILHPTFAQPPATEPAQVETSVDMPATAQQPVTGLPVPHAVIEAPVVPSAPCVPWDGACGAPGGRFWVTGEYLFAWLQGSTVPALVTTSPPGTAQTSAGVLGAPGTSPVIGGVLNGDMRSGMRFQTGYWFNPEHTYGIEAGVMMLESQATMQGLSSTGTPILARPYIDAATSSPQAVLVAFPGVASGNVNLRATSGNFYEAHIDTSETLIDHGPFRLYTLVGYRFFRFDDGLNIGQTVMPTGGAFAPGTQLTTNDSFHTHNTFNGVDLGLRGKIRWDNLTLSMLGKIAVGYIHRDVFISGNQVVSVPGSAPVAQTGGLYALSSNIGTHGSNDWGMLPELGLNLAWQVRPGIRLNVGYTVMWMDRVARAADQINLSLNPNLFPPATNPTGPNQPAFNGTNRQDVWIQALSAGVTFTF